MDGFAMCRRACFIARWDASLALSASLIVRYAAGSGCLRVLAGKGENNQRGDVGNHLVDVAGNGQTLACWAFGYSLFKKCTYFIFGCAGSSLLHTGFL